jgi:tRNA threonylcarbamoyladenosine biosynthesis protein TsaE
MTTPPPSSPPLRVQRALPDEAATHALGVALADQMVDLFASSSANDQGFTIHLSGDLGAGKTALARALLGHLGVQGRVKSPTYTLVESYVVEISKGVESRQRMNLYCYHFDFYRFEDPQEWLDAGFRDYFSDAALRLVEWPEKAYSESGSLLPVPDLHVTLDVHGEGRIATLEANGERGAACLTRLSLADRSTRPAAHAGTSSRPV